jgi:hypothetical protein
VFMTKDYLWQEHPTKWIEPVDGLAVTAAVWREAHDYHRQRQRFHALLSHGPGIVAGLEVVASDPPDSTVYILPGVAVDPRGETIAVTEPVAYDVGAAASPDPLYLLLTYEQSRPRSGGQEEGPLYTHAEFGIEARPILPDRHETAYIELARFRRQDRQAPLANARDAEGPGLNEIDMRFRLVSVGPAPRPAVPVCMAVSYAGGAAAEHGRGATYLARALRRSRNHPGDLHAWVDVGVPLTPGLESYTLVYLVGQGAFQLNRDEMNALYAYLQGGGTVLFESCRRGVKAGDPPADASFSDVLASLGISAQELPPGHDLLVEPYLFAAPPPGFETEGTPKVLLGTAAGGHVILSSCDYGCLWQGERRGRAASREEIRTAMEWGNNLVAYALKSRQEALGKG